MYDVRLLRPGFYFCLFVGDTEWCIAKMEISGTITFLKCGIAGYYYAQDLTDIKRTRIEVPQVTAD